MIIMTSTLAAAINECRHITTEELIMDNIKNLDRVNTFEIAILDDYSNIIYRHYVTCTEEQAKTKAKNACGFYKSLDKCNYEFRVYKIK